MHKIKVGGDIIYTVRTETTFLLLVVRVLIPLGIITFMEIMVMTLLIYRLVLFLQTLQAMVEMVMII